MHANSVMLSTGALSIFYTNVCPPAGGAMSNNVTDLLSLVISAFTFSNLFGLLISCLRAYVCSSFYIYNLTFI